MAERVFPTHQEAVSDWLDRHVRNGVLEGEVSSRQQGCFAVNTGAGWTVEWLVEQEARLLRDQDAQLRFICGPEHLAGLSTQPVPVVTGPAPGSGPSWQALPFSNGTARRKGKEGVHEAAQSLGSSKHRLPELGKRKRGKGR